MPKTKTLDDYVVPDDSLFEVLDDFDDSDLLVYLYDYQKLLLNNISLQRFSQDSSPVNNYGYNLLDFCKKMNICGDRNVLSKRQVWMSIFHIINFKKKYTMQSVCFKSVIQSGRSLFLSKIKIHR